MADPHSSHMSIPHRLQDLRQVPTFTKFDMLGGDSFLHVALILGTG